ncbi:cilia- and flagella-associated protein 47 [Discoglossus pictus]
MEELIDKELGVKVSPSLLHFMDALVGQCYRATLIVQNISPVAKSFRIQGPRDSQFTLIAKNPNKPIASGLHVTATIEYRPLKKEDIRDRLLVYVDKDVIEVPLLGFTPSCYLEIDSEVNFGNITANSNVVYKEIGIMNHGSSPGHFRIKYNGDLPITIEPSSGTVEPKSLQLIKVDLCADKPQVIDEIAKVKLQGRDEKLLRIKGNVVNQFLELLDVSGKALQCIHFGSIFFGTSKTHQAVVYNNSPETMNWVSVLDDDALGVEMGTDLEKTTDAVLQSMESRLKQNHTFPSSLVSCLPNQGVLLPFQKTLVTLCFSPKQDQDIISSELPPRQDYALFMRFEPVGSKDGFLQSNADHIVDRKVKKKYVELAVTGSGLPVELTFSPGPVYNFKECLIGEQINIFCSLKNESELLPVVFSFRKISHFNISPPKGKIQPGETQDVLFSFAPHQVGTFKVKQVLDILGLTTEDNSPPLRIKAFHQKRLTFNAVCKSLPNKIVMKINPGISPAASNPVGQFVPASHEESGMYTGSNRIATLNSEKTHIHDYLTKTDAGEDALIAFPNDRATSIRPSDWQMKYRTIFTKVERYNYVDPDYAYTEEEERLKKTHKDYYANYIRGLREHRLDEEKAREFEDANNSVDIGITPGAGLQPPDNLTVKSFDEKKQKPKTAPTLKGRLLTTRQLAAEESRSLATTINDGLNAMPSTAREKEDCSLTLTPQQLHQIVIGPSTIDFGEVCVQSTSVKEMYIINSLNTYIWVQIDIECDELQQTSPLSHVVPPMSKTEIPVVFETQSLGTFKKSITYTVNNKHNGHVLVTAEAVSVALEMSMNELVLKPNSSFLAETGFRSSITLYNRRNYPAEFVWKPIVTKNGIAFSIRPAKGTVDAYKDLQCEVVWHPIFSSPDIGEFNLCVPQGNTLKLKCIAKLGPTSVQFADQRVLFHEVPQGLTTLRTAILQNTGANHAYFQVVDVSPLYGMTVTPSQGVVPVGGYTMLKIYFTPQAVLKFDTRVEVSVRNTKSLELRIGGSVLPPKVDISVRSFLFSGVTANSSQCIPFVLQNNGAAHAKVEFDFSRYQDFFIKFKDEPAFGNDPLHPHLYAVELEEKESLECALYFNPKEVAAYDFELPMNTNFTGALSHNDSSIPVTPTSSEKHIVVPRPQIVNAITPPCRVNATVLKPQLKFSTSKLEFDLPSGYLDLGIVDSTLCSKTLELNNISKQMVTWKLNLNQDVEGLEDGVFKFSEQSGILEPGQMNSITVSFCPSGPGKYSAEIPVILNDNPSNYFTPFYLYGHVRKPKLIFSPPIVILTPVPLDTEAQAIVNITAKDFSRESALKVEIPEVQLDNGNWGKLFSVDFPNGHTVASSGDVKEGLICQIRFRSFSPVSCLVDLLFTDENNNQFSLQVAAVAENCILTVYPYLAYHRMDQQVILRSGLNENSGKGCDTGEAVLRPCYIPETPSQSTSSSSLGAATSSTYEESVTDEDNAQDLERTHSDAGDNEHKRKKDKLELSFYPDEETDEWIFFQKVSDAVQTWFSLYGWPGGCNPISIPQSFWSDMCQVQMSKSEGKAKKPMNTGKLTKTIYDMLFYLSGQMLPGITASQSLPSDPTERVLQLHWQHATLLTFLKNQGASLPHVKPEYLFDPLDYERWVQVQLQIKELQKPSKKCLGVSAAKDLLIINDNAFQSISKRVWTDVLLQIYKVLILSCVSESKNNRAHVCDSMPRISSEPLSSNIYSTSERILLTWLNVNYEKMRKTIWENCDKGDVPATRWIINFDKDLLDGLVLAAQIAAYCPYFISTHLVHMYTNPENPEECLHNCLIVVNAFRAINIDIDIQATDICDPNPVTMLMLCVYLHENLPLYRPKKTVTFEGALRDKVSRKICLKNPGTKPLVYNATIVGRDSDDFSLPKGYTMTIAPKNQMALTVEYRSRFLHPAEGTLLLVSKPANGESGMTMAFSLQSKVTHLTPIDLCKHESPCYELNKISLAVQNPYKSCGVFRVILVESTSYLSFPDHLTRISQLMPEKADGTSSLGNSISKVLCDSDNEDMQLDQEYQSKLLHQFFCPLNHISLEEFSSASLPIHFLPFDLGKRYCTVIFMNEQIGDFVYMIEGTGISPLPMPFLPLDGLNVLHRRSITPGSTKNVVYLKCRHKDILEETLKIPLVNEAKEKALALAAQMKMSDLEYERRKITGTLESSTVRFAVATLGLNTIEAPGSPPFIKKIKSIDYDVEISMSQHFEVPRKLNIPVSAKSRITGKQVPVEGGRSIKEKGTENGISIPIRFVPKNPGRYSCQILLRSSHDIRLYMIECVVNPNSTETELEFITNAWEAVIQDIPIKNVTDHDWKLQAILKGDHFYGPPFLIIPAGETCQYSLMFKPISECFSLGRLILQNETDGTEHIFGLKGIGQEPLALDHVVIDCQVRQITQKVLMVPNYTNRKLIFKAISDIPFVGGPQTITVKPGTPAPYKLKVSPWKRGLFKGQISFVTEDDEQQQFQDGLPPEVTDGTETLHKLTAEEFQAVNTSSGGKSIPYKVWFSLEINSKPAPPERTISVTCPVLETISIDIPVSNPTLKELNWHVLVEGDGLIGETQLTLQAKETFPYVVKYSPARKCISTGSVLFQSDIVGEFWYALQLTADKPLPITLPEVCCELGKWTRLSIPLSNPTDEIFELETFNSNPENFLVEVDSKKPLLMQPHTSTEVTVQFCPSALGKGNHQASITFKNSQLEEWIFYVSGEGLIPQPMEPASITAIVSSVSSIVIPFKNPTEENVLVDVILTDQEQTMHRLSASVLRNSINKEPAFCLPLKQMQGIPLGPKEKLDIPLLFAPDTMKLYDSLVVVHMEKENGDIWAQDSSKETSTELKSITRTEHGDISGIRWIYPVHGIPESQPSKSVPAVVTCQARNRTEERVEVLLTGVVPGQTVKPAPRNGEKYHIQEEVQVSNGLSTTEEFLYEISYESEDMKSQLEPSLAIELVRKERDAPSGIVTLIFNIIFAPSKPMRHSATLVVQCATGGIWKFPIQFVATEPNVDDVIEIESVGLNKESVVGFRLTSHTRYPEPFSAYFLPGSDTEFSVSPQSGELLPLGTAGALMTVGFKPTMYSKKHKATLIVQTSRMQWSYDVIGLTPKTTPPKNVPSKICSVGNKQPEISQRRNFLRENQKLIITAVSSPVKGAPLVLRTK